MTLAFAIIITAFMLTVIVIDVRSYTIPNWLNLALLAFFPIWGFLAPMPIDWLSSLYMALILFAGGVLFFALRMMGGGDAKLFTVCGLFTGLTEEGVVLVLYTALIGGAITIVTVLLRYVLPPLFRALKVKKVPRVFTIGEPMVPYGPAIAIALLILVWTGRLPGMVVSELNII